MRAFTDNEKQLHKSLIVQDENVLALLAEIRNNMSEDLKKSRVRQMSTSTLTTRQKNALLNWVDDSFIERESSIRKAANENEKLFEEPESKLISALSKFVKFYNRAR